MRGGTDTRRGAFLVALAATLAGCVAGTSGAGDDDAAAGAAPGVSCPDPCARAIDSGVRWEPSVAVNPANALHLAASSHDQSPDPLTRSRASWGLAHVSLDGGETWTTTRIPGGRGAAPTHPLARYNWMDDATVTFLADGTLLYSALVFDVAAAPGAPAGSWGGMALVVLRSTDGGRTFPDVAIVHEGAGRFAAYRVGPRSDTVRLAVDAQDKQWFAVAPDGTVLLAWSRNLGGTPACGDPSPTEECTQLVLSTSTDAGRSWSRPTVIAEGGLYSGAFPLVRDDGAWVVSYRDTTRSEANVALSTDRGATWTTRAIDATTKFPVLAKTRGPHGDRIHLAYPQADGDHDGPQVVTLRWSDDGGETWSAPLALDAPPSDGRTIPALAPAGDGVLVTWWRPRGDGADLLAATVRDGRASAPLALDASDGPTATLGDYMGLAALPDGSAYAVWNARHGDAWTVAGARLVAE